MKKIENKFIKKYGKKNVNKIKNINFNSYSNFLVKKKFKNMNIKVLYEIFTNIEINKVLFYSKIIVSKSSNTFLGIIIKILLKKHYKINENKVLEISKKYCNCSLDNKRIEFYKLSENEIISALDLSKDINFISELKTLKGKEFYWLESEFIDNKDNRKMKNNFKIAIDSFTAKVLFLYWEKISN